MADLGTDLGFDWRQIHKQTNVPWINSWTIFFRRMKMKRAVFQKDGPMKGWVHGLGMGENGCLWCSSKKTTVKHNVFWEKKPLLSASDERFTPVLSQTHTFGSVLHLHRPSLYQTFLCLVIIPFTQCSLLSPFLCHSIFQHVGKMKTVKFGNRIGPHSGVNKGWSSVKWILHLAVTESMVGDGENP